MCLYYFLIRRLLESQPTCVFRNSLLYQFDSQGVVVYDPAELTPLLPVLRHRNFWILIDEQPTAIFLKSECEAFSIIATSPDIERNLKLAKAAGMESYYLDIWEWRELYAGRYLGLKTKRDFSWKNT